MIVFDVASDSASDSRVISGRLMRMSGGGSVGSVTWSFRLVRPVFSAHSTILSWNARAEG